MLTLTEILRASHVRRWNIVATSRDQSVAEHQYNVCMIVRALCKRLDIDDEVLIKAALEHDLDEVVFGDIPSPMKARMAEDGIYVNDYIANTMREMTGFQTAILKLADLLDAYLFIRDHAIGRHAKQVEGDVFERMKRHMNNCNTCSPTVEQEIRKFVTEVLDERI